MSEIINAERFQEWAYGQKGGKKVAASETVGPFYTVHAIFGDFTISAITYQTGYAAGPYEAGDVIPQGSWIFGPIASISGTANTAVAYSK